MTGYNVEMRYIEFFTSDFLLLLICACLRDSRCMPHGVPQRQSLDAMMQWAMSDRAEGGSEIIGDGIACGTDLQ